jgi:ribose transport system substrate-binding protein
MMRNSNGKYLISLSIALLIAVIGLAVFLQSNEKTASRFRVVYVPKATDDTIDFWRVLLDGVEMAAEEYDVELTILGPDSETDFDGQIRCIEEAIQMNPDAIILSPSSMSEITTAANGIVTAGIRLVLVDSELEQNIQSLVVETDNYEAGRKMGVFVAGCLPEDPVVGIISHIAGSSTARDREEGFRDGLGEAEQYVVGTVYSNSNYEKAYEVTKQLLKQHPEINVLAGLNEYSAVGAARAVKELELVDEISMVGVDSSIEQVQLLEEGVFDAIVVQDPFSMGYLGLENTVALLRGEMLPEKIDSGSELITRENMYTEENQKLLFPFLE